MNQKLNGEKRKKVHKIYFNDGYRNKGVEGFYYKKGNVLCLIVWGTNSREDIINNFRALPMDEIDKGVYVHPLWNRYTDYLMENVPKWMEKTGTSIIVIKGHSMGGAIAQILTYRLMQKYSISVSFESLGGAMAGNRKFINFVDKYGVFKRHRADFIPFVPFIPFFFLYGRPKGEMTFGSLLTNPYKAHHAYNFHFS